MTRILRFVLIVVCLLLCACQHTEETNVQKANLHKAASYNVQLGLGYLKQGDRSRAKKKLLLAQEQAPGSPDVNAAMAYYFEQTHEYEQARNYYLKALSLSSQSGAQLNNYGAFLCRQGDYKNAEIYFLNAVKDVQYLHVSGAYENAGLCALAIPDNDKAKRYFIKALNQDPSRRESLYELVTLESKMGNHFEALSTLQRYSDLVLNDRDMLLLAKNIARKAGKYDVATEYEYRFKKMEPNTDNSGVNNEYNNHNR